MFIITLRWKENAGTFALVRFALMNLKASSRASSASDGAHSKLLRCSRRRPGPFPPRWPRQRDRGHSMTMQFGMELQPIAANAKELIAREMYKLPKGLARDQRRPCCHLLPQLPSNR